MAEQTGIGINPQAGQVSQLGAIKTLLGTPTVHLFKTSFTPTPQSPLTDFVAGEADFVGYAAAAAAMSAVGLDGSGLATMVSARAFFQATNAVTPNDIGGMWIQDGGGTPALQGYCIFPAPVPMDAALLFVAITLTWQIQGMLDVDIES